MARRPLDEALCVRVRTVLAAEPGVSERRMFGGACFTVDGAMACGVVGDELMIRVGPESYEQALGQRHVRPMDFTGRPLRGFVFVSPEGFRTHGLLADWVARGVSYAKIQAAKPEPVRSKRGPKVDISHRPQADSRCSNSGACSR